MAQKAHTITARLEERPFFDNIGFGRELYHLLSIFMASPSITAIAGRTPKCPVRSMINAFEKNEIKSLLLLIAIRIRNADDLVNVCADKTFQGYTNDAGTWRKNPEAKVEVLNLREACNKIIHAHLFSFQRGNQYNKRKRTRYLKPTVIMYDKDDKTGWEARLDVQRFVRMGYVFGDYVDSAFW